LGKSSNNKNGEGKLLSKPFLKEIKKNKLLIINYLNVKI
jgi:hypothetical protein